MTVSAPPGVDQVISVCADCELTTDREFMVGHVNYSTRACGRCGENTAWFVLDRGADEPLRQGWFGQPEAVSTSVALVRLPQVVYDVNCYYADLGVPTDATRRQIKQAYQAKGNTPSPRHAMIVKTLLDPEMRFRYDMVEPGNLWMDEEIAGIERRLRTEAASEANARMGEKTFDADFDADHIETAQEILDNERAKYQDGVPPGSALDVTGWSYSYYVWRTDSRDTDRLDRWQKMLVAAIAERRVEIELAVGLVGRSQVPFQIRRSGKRWIVFLSDAVEPNEVIAKLAASRMQVMCR